MFCWYISRDRILNNCIHGWKLNFKLYGAAAKTANSIAIYNYLLVFPHTSYLSRDDQKQDNFSIRKNIYIPGKQVKMAIRFIIDASKRIMTKNNISICIYI